MKRNKHTYTHTHTHARARTHIPECLWVDLGRNGINNDGKVWNKSGLHQVIEDGKIKLLRMIRYRRIIANYPRFSLVILRLL